MPGKRPLYLLVSVVVEFSNVQGVGGGLDPGKFVITLKKPDILILGVSN